ncbi:MAG: hypothetical protein OEV94_11735 [Deltaproteobacteria bacterium]|nr:hypothetical protein [Deltaproteobacteria bacterium]
MLILYRLPDNTTRTIEPSDQFITNYTTAHAGTVELDALKFVAAQEVPAQAVAVCYVAPADVPAYLLEWAKQAANQRLAAACQAAIEAGVTGFALGSAHTYPTDKTSQINLTAEVSAAIIDGPIGTYAFMCANVAGVWARRPHTDVQIKAAGVDARTHVKTQLTRLDTLRAQVAAATTVAAVEAVVW